MKKRWYPAAALLLTAADQVLKTYVEQNMERGEEKFSGGPVVLRRVENRGLPLNLLSGRPEVVKALSGTAAGFVTVLYLLSLAKKSGCVLRTGLTLVTAGAWSNTFDRFARGYVVDDIGFRGKNETLSRITYNLADFFIAAGSLLLLPAALLMQSGSGKQKDTPEKDTPEKKPS